MVDFNSGRWVLWEGSLVDIPKDSLIAMAVGDPLTPATGYFSKHAWVRLESVTHRGSYSHLNYFMDQPNQKGTASRQLVFTEEDRMFVFQQWEPYDPDGEPEDDCL